MLLCGLSGSRGTCPHIGEGILGGCTACPDSFGFRELSSLPRLKLMLRGVARSKTLQQQSTRPRLPITGEILGRLFRVLNQHPAGYWRTMMWTVCSAAFFGFFRLGEIVVSSTSAFNPAIHLSWEDVSVDDPEQPTVVRIYLRVSKCDQNGRGVAVFLGRVESPVCPVVALLSFMAVRGARPGPFFIKEDGAPGAFVTFLRGLLTETGLEASLFSGHSFRIGAATTAAMAGLQDSTIQALGRWSSSAFQSYVRMPRQHLVSYGRDLANWVHD